MDYWDSWFKELRVHYTGCIRIASAKY